MPPAGEDARGPDRLVRRSAGHSSATMATSFTAQRNDSGSSAEEMGDAPQAETTKRPTPPSTQTSSTQQQHQQHGGIIANSDFHSRSRSGGSGAKSSQSRPPSTPPPSPASQRNLLAETSDKTAAEAPKGSCLPLRRLFGCKRSGKAKASARASSTQALSQSEHPAEAATSAGAFKQRPPAAKRKPVMRIRTGSDDVEGAADDQLSPLPTDLTGAPTGGSGSDTVFFSVAAGATGTNGRGRTSNRVLPMSQGQSRANAPQPLDFTAIGPGSRPRSVARSPWAGSMGSATSAKTRITHHTRVGSDGRASNSPGHDDIANEMLVRYLETTTCSANEIQRIVQSTKVLNRSLRFYHVVGSLLIQKGEYVLDGSGGVKCHSFRVYV